MRCWTEPGVSLEAPSRQSYPLRPAERERGQNLRIARAWPAVPRRAIVASSKEAEGRIRIDIELVAQLSFARAVDDGERRVVVDGGGCGCELVIEQRIRGADGSDSRTASPGCAGGSTQGFLERNVRMQASSKTPEDSEGLRHATETSAYGGDLNGAGQSMS